MKFKSPDVINPDYLYSIFVKKRFLDKLWGT